MTELVVAADVREHTERAAATWHEHPSWCAPAQCSSASEGGGDHQSERFRIASTKPTEPCSLVLFLAASPLTDVPLAYLETYHDPDVNAALEMDDEPDVAVLSLAQAAQLRLTIDDLLARVS